MPEKNIREEIITEFKDDPEVMKWVDSVIEIQLLRTISDRANVSITQLKELAQMLEEGGEEGHQQAIKKLHTLIRRKEISQKLESERRKKVIAGHKRRDK